MLQFIYPLPKWSLFSAKQGLILCIFVLVRTTTFVYLCMLWYNWFSLFSHDFTFLWTQFILLSVYFYYQSLFISVCFDFHLFGLIFGIFCFVLGVELMSGLSELLSESVIEDPGHHTLGVVIVSNATGVPSAPSDLQVVLMSMRFVTLSWAAPAHSGLSDVTGYSVFWKEDLSDR